MNKELYDAFKKLTDTAKNELKSKLVDSPVAKKLFDFLDGSSNRNFKNRDVVEALYPEELRANPYNVLENRYFKLRKKFVEEWLHTEETTVVLLTDEEAELQHCKSLILQNHKEQAYQRLSQLEKECWNKNIFEVLPAVIDNLIFCSQTLNRLERNNVLYERQSKAIVLQADCYRMITLARKVYEINFKKGVIHAKKELNEIKDLGVKHKNYPRFTMCYHHVSLYYKLGSRDYVDDMQVISRHFKQYKELNAKHPQMPLVSYRKNYNVYQHLHYTQIQVFYHYNRMEFEDAYLAMKEIWNLIHTENSIYSLFKTESIYYNMFSSQKVTGRYAEAEKTIAQYMDFLKENNNSSKLSYAHTLQGMLLSFTYSSSKEKDAPYFLDKTEEYIKSIKGDANMQTSANEVALLRSKLLWLTTNKKDALKIIREKEVKQYLNEFELFELFEDTYTRPTDVFKLRDLKKLIQKRLVNSKHPIEAIELKWLEKAIGEFYELIKN